MAQWIKNLSAIRETLKIQVRFLGREDPLEEGVATHSSILAWRILGTEEPGRLQSIGHKESDATEHSTFFRRKKQTNKLTLSKHYNAVRIVPSLYNIFLSV